MKSSSDFFQSKQLLFLQSSLSNVLFIDPFSQFQVGSCKYQYHYDGHHVKTNIFPPDYDTIETVTCKSQYMHDEERQRSLQHFIQIEDLPEKFTKVNLPSGPVTIMD